MANTDFVIPDKLCKLYDTRIECRRVVYNFRYCTERFSALNTFFIIITVFSRLDTQQAFIFQLPFFSLKIVFLADISNNHYNFL